MTDMSLAIKIDRLASIENITALKNKYFRALDQQLFDEVEACFTINGVIDYGPAGVYEKVSDFVQMIAEYAKTNTATGVHLGFNPEITVLGDKATGHWLCTYNSVDTIKGISFSQTGTYQDEYQRIDGEWRILRTTNKSLFNATTTVANGALEVSLG